MAWTMSVYRNAASISAIVQANWSSIYGRQTNTDVCQAQTVTFDVVYDSAGLGTTDPNLWAIGDRIEVNIKNAALATAKYFSGTITDILARHHEMTIIATSDTMSSVNRNPITVGANTGALTGTAINTALTAVQTAGGLPSKTITTSTGTNTVTTAVQTNVNAVTFINQLVASEPNGVLLEEIGGIRFSDYNDRRIATMAASQKFDLSALGNTIQWGWQLEKTVSDFVNTCNVTWTAGTSIYSDTTSVTTSGAYNRSVTTYIDNVSQADYNALRIVQHGLVPGWRTSGIILDMSAQTDATRDTIFKNMRTGSYVKLPTLITGAQTEFFVEGWTDRFTYSITGSKQWFRELYVSDIIISAAAQRYVDVVSGVTYATVNSTLRWIDLEQTNI